MYLRLSLNDFANLVSCTVFGTVGFESSLPSPVDLIALASLPTGDTGADGAMLFVIFTAGTIEGTVGPGFTALLAMDAAAVIFVSLPTFRLIFLIVTDIL